MPGRSRSRREFTIGDLGGRAGQRPVGVVRDRHLPVEAARRRDAVPPVCVDEAIAGHVPQPQLERHRWVREVVAEAAVRLDEHVLHDVAGVHPPLHHPVHPAVDEPPDRRAVPREQVIDRRGIAAAHPLEEHERGLGLDGRGGGFGRTGHDLHPTNVSPDPPVRMMRVHPPDRHEKHERRPLINSERFCLHPERDP